MASSLALPFNQSTRQKFVQLPTQTRPTGGGITSLVLPKTGLLARLWLKIRGSVAGSLSNPNAFGFSSVLRRVQLVTNSAITLFDVSGPGYFYLLADMLESEYIRQFGQNNAKTAVTATTFILDMVVPVASNLRDPLGMIMLQNEQTVVTLQINWEADANVATGATVTATCVPWMEFFTVPLDPRSWPPLNIIHQILQDSQDVSGSGDVTYNWPRGNTYMQLIHGLGYAASGADNFTAFKVRVNQSDYLFNAADLGILDMQYEFYHGGARPAGVIPFDMLATSGLGNYGSTRDMFNSALVTDLASVITASTSGTLDSIRRQLVQIA